ncbi:ArdC-like ssDNA-binding domain-containing protein [Vagococcus sp. JNUCC 83]
MAKLTEIIQNLTNQAKEEIKQVATSEKDIQEFLDFQANFYTYSINNQLLIYRQRRGATCVLGFSEIKKQGLQLLKGSKAIKILAPLIYKEKDENGKEKSVIKGFKYVNVFDLTQTNLDPEKYPNYYPNKPINFKANNVNIKDFNNRIDKLTYLLNTSIKLDNSDKLRGARGGYFLNDHTILLNNGNTPTQNIKTAIHELAHAKLHHIGSKRHHDTKAIKETQAEMTAYIVCRYFGIDTSNYSINYISNWSEKLTAIDKEELIPVFDDIQKTAKEFITILNEEKKEKTA